MKIRPPSHQYSLSVDTPATAPEAGRSYPRGRTSRWRVRHSGDTNLNASSFGSLCCRSSIVVKTRVSSAVRTLKQQASCHESSPAYWLSLWHTCIAKHDVIVELLPKQHFAVKTFRTDFQISGRIIVKMRFIDHASAPEFAGTAFERCE